MQQERADEDILKAFGQNMSDPNEAYERKKQEVMKSYRPKDDIGFKKLYCDWLHQFHKKYLSLERTKSAFHGRMFLVKNNRFEEKINPDIPG